MSFIHPRQNIGTSVGEQGIWTSYLYEPEYSQEELTQIEREAAAFWSAPTWLKAAAAFGVVHTSLRGAAFGATLVSRQLLWGGQHWA